MELQLADISQSLKKIVEELQNIRMCEEKILAISERCFGIQIINAKVNALNSNLSGWIDNESYLELLKAINEM